MSYYYYSVEGFGFNVNEIKTNAIRLKQFIERAPKFNQQIITYFKEQHITSPTFDDYLDYGVDCVDGLPCIIKEVIEECENISLVAAENFDEEWFVLLIPSYPWESISLKQQTLSSDKLEDIFNKYIKILTDTNVPIGYQSVENGG